MSHPALRLATLAFSTFFAATLAAQSQDIPASRPSPQEARTEKQRKKQQKKAKDEVSDQLDRFIEEDGKYIVTPEEREAFKRLGSNEEREQYIEIIFQRRNPNPDSSVNEFKE